VDGKNYLAWAKDVKIKLHDMSLDPTIAKPKAGKEEPSKANKAKVFQFLRHHLHPDMKSEYITERDPLVLCESLKGSFQPAAINCAP